MGKCLSFTAQSPTVVRHSKVTVYTRYRQFVVLLKGVLERVAMQLKLLSSEL